MTWVDGAPLPAVGRAERRASPDGRERWRFRREDEAVARRLLRLGAANVGGFVEEDPASSDARWITLVRRATSRTTLAELLRARKGPWPWREAVAFVRALAAGLSACEQAALFPGPLTPEAVALDEGALPMLPALGLSAALAGAAESASRSAGIASPLWIPPEQAAGAPWDAAANRYALGLILYRLLAGEHPFAGAGLRHALEEAARGDAPPFREEVAAELPLGLQSFCLRLIRGGSRGAAERPSSAAEVARELAAFLEEKRTEAAATAAAARRAAPAAAVAVARAEVAATRTASAKRSGRATPARATTSASAWAPTWWPVAVGAAVAIASVAVVVVGAPAPGKPRPVAVVGSEAPLTEAQTGAGECARCHPRQAAEWRRSVMAHAVTSPLFNALEVLIEEQVGRDDDCPNGAGILRKAASATACRVAQTGTAITGSGGEHWCVNCHSPAEKLDAPMPAWEGRGAGDPRTRRPVRDILGERAMEGVSCGFCHEVHGPVPARGAARGGYEGNPTWTSFLTGATFAMRPEDARGLPGIGNSGYDLRPADFVIRPRAAPGGEAGSASVGAHLATPRATKAYLRSSEFCGSCHDVRLFGTDALGAGRGEHFKRLRNAYSEWALWAAGERRAGRQASSCQDCHMSEYPGVCVRDDGSSGDAGCPSGFRFAERKPGTWPRARVATSSADGGDVVTHWFSGVDVPLSRELGPELVDEGTLDVQGTPLSARRRRDMLLRRTFRFGLGDARRGGQGLEIPVEIENVGAGHRVPAGFSQEREFWVHLVVRDGDGRAVYEVGRVDRSDEDLRDKTFARVNVRDDDRDRAGRPQGLFGADVSDGPDVPAWQPLPTLGGTSFRGRGLVNFQNGFLRCVRCIGTVAADGHCEAGPGQGSLRAARFADGDYDLDSGACRSNLSGMNALFETYFPIGALDASRGLAKGPDAIIDTRSLPPGVPLRYVYDLPTSGRRGPFTIRARLLFRAFPPFLIKAFAAYEREQTRRGLRPSGALVTDDMLGRLEVVEVGRADAEVR
jgi:hypothetical protein